MDKTSLAYSFKLPPEKAVEFFRSKGYAITFDWHEMLKEAHAKAFTVAKATRLDILQDIRGAVDSALNEGKTLRQFQQELTPVLQKKSWWGRKEVMDPATGELRVSQLGSPRRMETIYQTNLQTAYMSGRYQAMTENATARPFWQYVAVMDSRTRPAHQALHGKVFRHDDPVWQYLYPPNGWRCRCRVRPLSAADVAARDLTVESSTGQITFVDQPLGNTGQTTVVASYTGVGSDGRRFTLTPDAGWDYNPGQAWSNARLIESKLIRLDADLGATLFADLQPVARKSIQENWLDWLEPALQGEKRKDFALLGSMGKEEIAYLKALGREPQTAAITINDRLVSGKKAARHIKDGNALTEQEWRLLPNAVDSPEAVLYDSTNGSVLYVYPSIDDPRRVKIVVQPEEYNKKLKTVVNLVATVFKVDANALLDTVKYKKIR